MVPHTPPFLHYSHTLAPTLYFVSDSTPRKLLLLLNYLTLARFNVGLQRLEHGCRMGAVANTILKNALPSSYQDLYTFSLICNRNLRNN